MAPASILARLGRVSRRHPARESIVRGEPGGEDPLTETAVQLALDFQQLAADQASGKGRSGHWVSVPVTDDLMISARGPGKKKVRLLEQIAGHIRKLTATGRRGPSRPEESEE